MNYGRVLNILGTFSVFISLMLAVPAAWALIYGEYETLPAFGISALIGVGGGLLLRRLFRESPQALYRREALLIVTGSWLIAAVVGALPFLISGMIPRVEDALFESMSGFTTTGSTILTKISGQPLGLLFWRSMTHWLGGMGIIVLFVAILPALGVGGRLLYQFEVPGLETDDLKPRIRETATALWKIYLGLTIAEVVLLMLLGLDLYNALTHTFGTLATGGFSTHDASVAHFDSAAVDGVITLFMFLAGINFSLYYRVRRQGAQVFLRDLEFRVYVFLMLGLSVLVTAILAWTGTVDGVMSSLRYASFQVVSIGTTTGYGTHDFERWPEFLRLLLVFLMFSGGSAGSTAGGMKVLRLILIFKFVAHEMRRFIRPRRVSSLMVGKDPVPTEVMNDALAYFALVVLIFIFSSLALVAMGVEMQESLTSVVATFMNIGPGLGAVGPTANFADIPAAGKVLHTLLMLFGRLEVFTAFSILMPGLYRD